MLTPDLLWALRGAGANFGVVTRFTFRLHAVGPTVYGGLIAWPFERARGDPTCLPGDHHRSAPRAGRPGSFCSMLRRRRSCRRRGTAKKICAMAVCYSGDLDVRRRGARADPGARRPRRRPARRAAVHRRSQSYLDETEPKGTPLLLEDGVRSPSSTDDAAVDDRRTLFAECPIPGGGDRASCTSAAPSTSATRTTAPSATGTRATSSACKACGSPDEPDGDAFRAVGPRRLGAGCGRSRPARTYINFQTADEDGRARPGDLRRQLRPPRRDQAEVRPGQPVAIEPEHPLKSANGGRA